MCFIMALIIALCLIFSLICPTKGCAMKVCYYRNDAPFRKAPNNITPEVINTKLCTHLIYTYAHFKDYKLTASLHTDEDSPWTVGIYTRFNKIKEKNPNLTTLLSVGGWNFGSEKFYNLVGTPYNRAKFVHHSVGFLRQRNFDGLELSWQFPGYRGGAYNHDYYTFTWLIKEIKNGFERESQRSGKRRLLLTAALAGNVYNYSRSYEIDKIAKELDFVTIMTYDYGLELPEVINSSPIYGDYPGDAFNIKYTVEYYLRKGIPKNKLVITLPLYGRAHRLSYHKNHEYRDSTYASFGKSVTTDDEQGLVAYFEICRWLENGVLAGRHQGVPYLSRGVLWAGYEDITSIRHKVMFVKRHGLAGIAYWSLDLDDVKKQWCKKHDKNLMETADETCRMNIPMSSIDPPLPSEPQRVLYPFVNPNGPVDRDYYFQDPPVGELEKLCQNKSNHEVVVLPGNPCYEYVECIHGWGTMQECPDGQVLDPVTKECEWAFNVPQCLWY